MKQMHLIKLKPTNIGRRRFFNLSTLFGYLNKERFPSKRKNKLLPRAKGPFEVLENINDNAYKVDLPCDYRVLAIFNVVDLSHYLTDDYLADLRIKSFQQGG